MLQLEELLNQFEQYKILIIGDVMLDSYLWGKVSRISPEAPVPIVSQTKKEYRMGGAANVAKNILSLGATPILCSVIGEDENGKFFKQLLRNLNLTDGGIIESSKRITTVKTRVISGTQQLLRVDNETEKILEEEIEISLIDTCKKIIENKQIAGIIFQDYDKGVITPKLIDEVTAFALSSNIPILVDPKKRNFNYYHHADLFKPNFKELTEGLNVSIDKNDFDSIYNAAKLLHKENLHKLIMVTLSEHGILMSDEQDYNVVPAEIRDISDVSGAGDTVISMASLCLAAKLTPEEIARFSNLAGGLVCEKVGVVPITKEMLINAYR